MIIQWIVLGAIICCIVFSYLKRYTLKKRVMFIGSLFIVSLTLMIPIFALSALTLIGLFLFERLWILLALVFIVDMVLNKHNKILMVILSGISITIYFFLRTII